MDASPAEVISHLQTFCSDSHHEFWPDSVSILDETLFHTRAIVGHHMLTDIYLLGLAVRRHAKLATFDSAGPVRAVKGASTRHLELIS